MRTERFLRCFPWPRGRALGRGRVDHDLSSSCELGRVSLGLLLTQKLSRGSLWRKVLGFSLGWGTAGVNSPSGSSGSIHECGATAWEKVWGWPGVGQALARPTWL